MEEFFRTENALRISLAVLIYTSSTTFSYYAEAPRPLIELDNERNVNPEIFLNAAPSAIAVDNEGTIFVSHSELDTLSVIDGDTLMVSTIYVGESPGEIFVDEFKSRVYVTNSDSNTISVIEQGGEGYRNIANVTYGGIRPYDLWVSGNRTYVINDDWRYPISIVEESSRGDWMNVGNISLEDPHEIEDITIFGPHMYVGRSYGYVGENDTILPNSTVSIMEESGADYPEYTVVENVSVGIYPELISPGLDFVSVTDVYPGDNTIPIIRSSGLGGIIF